MYTKEYTRQQPKKKHTQQNTPKESIPRDMNTIIKYENISKATLNKLTDIQYQETQLKQNGFIPQYSSVSHHVWFTNMNHNPRDIISYISKDFHDNQYTPSKIQGCIDDINNTFIQSILNLENGAISSELPMSDGKFYHILWTNFGIEDLKSHPELKNLRKLFKIDSSEIVLPEFVILNINDVMHDVVYNLSNPSSKIPDIIFNGLSATKADLLSLESQLEEMKHKKMFASMSDVMRVIAVKNIGGMYFDIDYNLFDQDKVHSEQHKYNLFDIIKNYNCVFGRDVPCTKTVCNAFISASHHDLKIMHSIWNVIQRNVQHPESVHYIKYANDIGSHIMCQTGPNAVTTGILKHMETNDNSEQNIVLNYGRLFYINTVPIEDEDFSSVGALGYDTWGTTW